MIYGVGTDIVEISRVIQGMEKSYFLKKLFTPKEIEYFSKRNFQPQVIAGNFAAKEAIVKALGVGFSSFSILDMEILRDEKGAPLVKWSHKAKLFIEERSISYVHISISHEKHYATSVAIAERRKE